MRRFALFQQKVDQMLGAVGQRLGQPFRVYRITPSSSGDFPGGWYLVSTQATLHRNRVRSTDAEVSMTSERVLWYEIVGDVSPYYLGDVFVQSDAGYFPGIAYGQNATVVPGTIEINALALCQHAPIRPPMGARIDRRVAIYRPNEAPLSLNGVLQWRSTHEEHQPLVLTNGTYAFGAPGGTASWVPGGFGTADRQTRGEDMPPDPPGMLPAPRYYCYLPPLPGYTPAEGDALITEDDARYRVTSPYTQYVGVVGSQLMLQRYIAQST